MSTPFPAKNTVNCQKQFQFASPTWQHDVEFLIIYTWLVNIVLLHANIVCQHPPQGDQNVTTSLTSIKLGLSIIDSVCQLGCYHKSPSMYVCNNFISPFAEEYTQYVL